jgi:hypothetical protein
MIENRIKPTTANFFWEGPISSYEITSINSFVRHGFNVNLWTYSKNPKWNMFSGIEIKDANQILPIKMLTQLNQNLQKSNYSSFSNLFRYRLLEEYGGWWFDTDCICMKNVDDFVNLTKERDYVLGLERKDYVGSAIMYFQDISLLMKIQEHAYKIIENNNFKLKWGQIGPDLITEIVILEGVIDNILSPSYFFPISPKKINVFFDSVLKPDDQSKLNDSFVTHTWNEMFRKYNINKTIMPPDKSFLFNEFKKNNVLIDTKNKQYSKLFKFRFYPVISLFFKIFSRLKVTINNFKK